jgi:CHCH-CHCH-like Cx9C, IMS import disulfide relay-system,
MGRKAGGMYINPKKFGGAGKPCMKEMLQFLSCLALNNNNDDKCMKYKDLLVNCAEAQVSPLPSIYLEQSLLFSFYFYVMYLKSIAGPYQLQRCNFCGISSLFMKIGYFYN